MRSITLPNNFFITLTGNTFFIYLNLPRYNSNRLSFDQYITSKRSFSGNNELFNKSLIEDIFNETTK